MFAIRQLNVMFAISATLTLASASSADLLVNGSFEDQSLNPGGGKVSNDWNKVVGWTSDQVNPSDSGIEQHPDRPSDGDYYAFLKFDDAGIWQVTGHTIAAGEIFTLEFDARDVSSDWDLTGSIFSTSDGGVTRTTLDSIFVDDVQTDGVTLVVSANDHLGSIGQQIGVELDNTQDWAGVDRVSLTVIPEPTSMALASLGALAILGRQRRRH